LPNGALGGDAAVGRGQFERLGPHPQERELLRRWHDHADVGARDALAEAMLPLARNLARRYANRGEPLDDLEQVACVGLMKAIDRFDPSREVRFATFAVPTIAGEIKRHFRDRGWMLRVPRDLQELSAKVSTAREKLTRDLGRAPTVAELAAVAETSEERVLEALSAADTYKVLSLDEPLVEGAGALDAIGADDEEFERTEQRMLLSTGMADLAERELQILQLRFFDGLTQREIAERIGISQMHVSRLLRRSLEDIRAAFSSPARRVA
jgi:RNA polymerase sigma-B factor